MPNIMGNISLIAFMFVLFSLVEGLHWCDENILHLGLLLASESRTIKYFGYIATL